MTPSEPLLRRSTVLFPWLTNTELWKWQRVAQRHVFSSQGLIWRKKTWRRQTSQLLRASLLIYINYSYNNLSQVLCKESSQLLSYLMHILAQLNCYGIDTWIAEISTIWKQVVAVLNHVNLQQNIAITSYLHCYCFYCLTCFTLVRLLVCTEGKQTPWWCCLET